MGTFRAVIVLAFLCGGAGLLVTAALGVVRMPDLFLRMSAASKASSLGAALMLLAVAIADGTVPVIFRAVAGIGFLFLTAPVASHLIGRAAWRAGVRLFEGTRVDEAAERARRP